MTIREAIDKNLQKSRKLSYILFGVFWCLTILLGSLTAVIIIWQQPQRTEPLYPNSVTIFIRVLVGLWFFTTLVFCLFMRWVRETRMVCTKCKFNLSSLLNLPGHQSWKFMLPSNCKYCPGCGTSIDESP